MGAYHAVSLEANGHLQPSHGSSEIFFDSPIANDYGPPKPEAVF